MSNNKSHNADYKLETVTGKVGNMGFKQTSGSTDTLASRGAKLIRTPLRHNTAWNNAVNAYIENNSATGLDRLEELNKLKR